MGSNSRHIDNYADYIATQLTLCDVINLLIPFLQAFQEVFHLSISDLKMKAN